MCFAVQMCFTVCFWPLVQVKVDNEGSDESYESSWSYMLHVQENALFQHHRITFHEEVSEGKVDRSARPFF